MRAVSWLKELYWDLYWSFYDDDDDVFFSGAIIITACFLAIRVLGKYLFVR